QLQLVVAESTDGGANWTTKYTTPSLVRAAAPAVAILANGGIGLLYDEYIPANDNLAQHFLTTKEDFVTTADTLLGQEINTTVQVLFSPYLGDSFDLISSGNTFYPNADDGHDGLFPNVSFQRDFTGIPGTGDFQLTHSVG